jgi:hypothetical protein
MVVFCFQNRYWLFKSGRYDIPKKGGGSREPFPFRDKADRKSSFLPLFFQTPFAKVPAA